MVMDMLKWAEFMLGRILCQRGELVKEYPGEIFRASAGRHLCEVTIL